MIGTAEQIIKWLFAHDRNTKFEIKQCKERRSLNANAYAWALITKIADKMRLSKEEVYLQMLKDFGQSQVITVTSNVDLQGIVKYYEHAGDVTLQGKDCSMYRVYKGSSEYDSKEMAILIDGIIQEAKQQNIETLPPEEVERLVSQWAV